MQCAELSVTEAAAASVERSEVDVAVRSVFRAGAGAEKDEQAEVERRDCPAQRFDV